MVNLVESLLTSEFNFGFELEAYTGFVNDANEDLYTYYDKDDETTVTTEAWRKTINAHLQQWWGKDAKMTYDGSLNLYGFEFPSPILALTPSNIKKVIEFLFQIQNYPLRAYTNETCGFHIHFSFPKMNEQDMAWIICHIALDEKLKKLLKFFTTKTGKTFNFFNKNYATVGFLEDIKNSIMEENYQKLTDLLSNEKYRILRIHPQDNIEWRGPRNFLNKNELETIKDFFIYFYSIISSIIKIMDKKEINGISRENFFKMVSTENIESHTKFNKNKENATKIAQAFVKNPIIMTKIGNKNFQWDDVFWKIRWLETSDIRENILTNVRYKKFKNPRVLAGLLKVFPKFLRYTFHDYNEIIDDENIYSLTREWKNNPKILIRLWETASNKTLENLFSELKISNFNFNEPLIKSFINKRFGQNNFDSITKYDWKS